MTFVMGDQQIDVNVTEGDEGTLFFDMRPTDPDAPDNIDIDGIFFNLADDSQLGALNFSPDGNGVPVTGIQSAVDGVSELANGQGPGGAFDAAVQFGTTAGSTEGEVESATFTLWSENGPLSFADIDLDSMQVVVNSDGANPESLPVTGVSQNWTDGDTSDADCDDHDTDGTGSGGTKGTGSGGTKGTGSGGTKGTGSGGTKGTGSGGTKGTGLGGTKGCGSRGTDGSDDHDTKLPGYHGDDEDWDDDDKEDVIYASASGGTKGSDDGGAGSDKASLEDIMSLMTKDPDEEKPEDEGKDEDEDDYMFA
jgi:hypothetical protein